MWIHSRHEGDTIDLIEGGFAAAHEIECRFAQAVGAELARGVLEGAHRLARTDELAHLVVERQRFGDGLATAKAGAAALPAAFAGAELPGRELLWIEARCGEQFRRRRRIDGAVRAIDPHQALRRYAVQGAHKTVRIQPHMQETADHVEDVVGMYRGEHQMSGQRGLHRDLRGFRIANLAHHDLIRVMAQDGSQAARKGESFLLVHRDLQDARKLILDRVFDGDDLVPAIVDFREDRVQRGGFSAAGRPGHEQHAVGLMRELAQPGHGRLVEPQRAHSKSAELVGQCLLVENAQHAVLSEDRWHDGYAEVHFAAFHAYLEATVLRDAPLGNVELGHDLDPRDDLLRHVVALRRPNLAEHAVDSVFDHQPAAGGLEVNVAGTDLERVVERRVDQLHHRARVLADGLERQVFNLTRRIGAASLDRDYAVHGTHVFFDAGQKGRDVVTVGEAEGERCGDAFPGPCLQIERERVADHQHEDAFLVSEQDALVCRGFREWQRVERRR